MADDFASTLAAARAGDEDAVAALYRRHDPRVLRYLRAQVRDHHDAADLAADTWLDAARNLHRFRGDEDGFAAWLFTIARRRLIDHRRARGRRPVDPVASVASVGPLKPAAGSAEDAAIAGTIGATEVLRIVDLLPPDQAEVVLLRVVADLDVAAVAQVTGRRPGTVRVIQHRALRRLAEALADPRNAATAAGDGTERDARAPTHRPR